MSTNMANRPGDRITYGHCGAAIRPHSLWALEYDVWYYNPNGGPQQHLGCMAQVGDNCRWSIHPANTECPEILHKFINYQEAIDALYHIWKFGLKSQHYPQPEPEKPVEPCHEDSLITIDEIEGKLRQRYTRLRSICSPRGEGLFTVGDYVHALNSTWWISSIEKPCFPPPPGQVHPLHIHLEQLPDIQPSDTPLGSPIKELPLRVNWENVYHFIERAKPCSGTSAT